MSVISGSLVDVDIHKDGRVFIFINKAFNVSMSRDEAYYEFRNIWEHYVEPIRSGLFVINAPIREDQLISEVRRSEKLNAEMMKKCGGVLLCPDKEDGKEE